VDLGLHERVAIVTGASQGIGRSIALALADEGADLVLVARGRERLEAVADEVRERGRRAVPVVADVTTVEGTDAIVRGTLDAFARVDVLVNNAGKGAPKPMLELTAADWAAGFDLNFFSAVRLSLACVPDMRARGWGRIVNISTRVAREPDPYFAPYAASKAALINFSKNLALAFSGDGVLTNCVVPGLIRSVAVQEAAERSAAATGRTVEEIYERTLAKRPIPAGRLGEPDDVAGLVALLASDRASWITGGCFTVDGGITRFDR
jgi:3-oxoacyl-[acyl-carrier protein] reductase